LGEIVSYLGLQRTLDLIFEIPAPKSMRREEFGNAKKQHEAVYVEVRGKESQQDGGWAKREALLRGAEQCCDCYVARSSFLRDVAHI
jgi:hypothetical protein